MRSNSRTYKGQSVLMTHTVLLTFIVFMIFVVASTFIFLREEFRDFATRNEIDQVCLMIRSGIDSIVAKEDFVPMTDTTSWIDLRLPDKIADTKYTAGFDNTSVVIRATGAYLNSTCRIGYNVTYTGSTPGGLTRILFTRSSSGRTLEMREI